MTMMMMMMMMMMMVMTAQFKIIKLPIPSQTAIVEWTSHKRHFEGGFVNYLFILFIFLFVYFIYFFIFDSTTND